MIKTCTRSVDKRSLVVLEARYKGHCEERDSYSYHSSRIRLDISGDMLPEGFYNSFK